MKKIAAMLGTLVFVIGFYYGSLKFYLWLFFEVLAKIEALEPMININFRVGIIMHDITSLIVYFLVFRYLYRRSIFAFSNMTPMKPQTTGIIVILSIFMGIWMMSFVRFPLIADNFPQFNEAFDFLLGKNIWFFVVFWVVHSFYKEIFLRGLIFNEMRKVMPLWLAIFILGIIYGALFFNLDPILTSYGMLGAVILCLIYVWQQSIWTTIVSEFVLFSTYFVYYLLDPAFGAGVVIAFVVSTPVILYLMYQLWRSRPAAAAPAARAADYRGGVLVGRG